MFRGDQLAPGAGLQFVLQDLSGAVFSGPQMLQDNLTLANFTPGNGTFLQLQEAYSPDKWNTAYARGELTYLGRTPMVPEAETYAMMLAGLAGLGLLARRKRKQAA
ncbi:PEP-CTERM sorting domain-containing protein [Massilia sp. W12]|uniref:PEP-CTERM sorting domain-containing protein n=1 Tax=Massilia sp. W12 TaxID=3126507 RepID=UPI0030CE6D71